MHAAQRAAVDLCCRASRDAVTAAGVQQLWFQVMEVGACQITSSPPSCLTLNLRAGFMPCSHVHVGLHVLQRDR